MYPLRIVCNALPGGLYNDGKLFGIGSDADQHDNKMRREIANG
jgi:hypothetical protein